MLATYPYILIADETNTWQDSMTEALVASGKIVRMVTDSSGLRSALNVNSPDLIIHVAASDKTGNERLIEMACEISPNTSVLCLRHCANAALCSVHSSFVLRVIAEMFFLSRSNVLPPVRYDLCMDRIPKVQSSLQCHN